MEPPSLRNVAQHLIALTPDHLVNQGVHYRLLGEALIVEYESYPDVPHDEFETFAHLLKVSLNTNEKNIKYQ